MSMGFAVCGFRVSGLSQWCYVGGRFLGLGQHLSWSAQAAVFVVLLAPLLVGLVALASDYLAVLLFRLSYPYGSMGFAAFAFCALVLGLWDVRG